jgi:hypothetical protein
MHKKNPGWEHKKPMTKEAILWHDGGISHEHMTKEAQSVRRNKKEGKKRKKEEKMRGE